MDLFHAVIAQHTPVKVDHEFKSEVLAVVPNLPRTGDPPETLNLMDLPNEILLWVCEQLDDELFAIAQVSRRLHYLALPMYFALKGMNPFTGELILFNDWSRDILRGLSIALFKPAMNSVYYTFDSLRSLKELFAANWALDRLSSVKELHVDSVNLRNVWSIDTEACRRGLQDLVQIALDKGCEILTVCVGGWGMPPHSMPLTSTGGLEGAIQPQISMLRFLKSPAHSHFQGAVDLSLKYVVRQLTILRIIKQRKRALRVFNLQSPLLVEPGSWQWTAELLNSTQITTLSIRDVYITFALLRDVTMHSLRDFSLDTCIADPGLFDFLLRHPKITHLRLGRYLRETKLNGSPSRLLPCLTHLTATVPHVIQLLKHRDVLPSLRSVCMIARNSSQHELDLVGLGDSLLAVKGRLENLEMAFEVSCESPTAAWSMDIVGHPNEDDQSDGQVSYQFENPLLCLSSIHLRLAFYSTPHELLTKWPMWLGLFPSLKHVTFTTLSKDGPADPSRRFQFISSIFSNCPRVSILEINGVQYDLPPIQ